MEVGENTLEEIRALPSVTTVAQEALDARPHPARDVPPAVQPPFHLPGRAAARSTT